MDPHYFYQQQLLRFVRKRAGVIKLAGLESAAGASYRFFGKIGGLLSPKDVETLTDVIPLVYPVSPSEVLTWRIDEAMRRYHLAIAKLGIKNG